MDSLGYTASIYGELVTDGEPFLQIAGDYQARILRNYSGLQHTVGMLSETTIEAPGFVGSLDLSVVRMVEEGDTRCWPGYSDAVQRDDGTTRRAAMGSVFVMRDWLM